MFLNTIPKKHFTNQDTHNNSQLLINYTYLKMDSQK